jgi:hypothetical protein
LRAVCFGVRVVEVLCITAIVRQKRVRERELRLLLGLHRGEGYAMVSTQPITDEDPWHSSLKRQGCQVWARH